MEGSCEECGDGKEDLKRPGEEVCKKNLQV